MYIDSVSCWFRSLSELSMEGTEYLYLERLVLSTTYYVNLFIKSPRYFWHNSVQYRYFSWKICFQYCAHATIPSLVIVQCWHKSFSNKMNYSNYFFTEWCLKQMYFNLLGIENEIYMSVRSFWLINVLKERKQETKYM